MRERSFFFFFFLLARAFRHHYSAFRPPARSPLIYSPVCRSAIYAHMPALLSILHLSFRLMPFVITLSAAFSPFRGGAICRHFLLMPIRLPPPFAIISPLRVRCRLYLIRDAARCHAFFFLLLFALFLPLSPLVYVIAVIFARYSDTALILRFSIFSRLISPLPPSLPIFTLRYAEGISFISLIFFVLLSIILRCFIFVMMVIAAAAVCSALARRLLCALFSF